MFTTFTLPDFIQQAFQSLGNLSMRDANRRLKRRRKSSVVETTVKSLDNAELLPGAEEVFIGRRF